MSEFSPRKADGAAFWWLIVVAVTFRAVLPFLSADGSYAAFHGGATQDPFYRDTLQRYPLEFLWYDHTLPVLFTAKNAIINNLLPVEWVRPASYGLVVILDCIATAITYAMARALGAGARVAMFAAMVVSLRFLLWEVWQWGEGWDSLNPFFMLLFAWTLIRLIRDEAPASAWAVGAAGGVLVLNFQFGAPIVFAGVAMGIVMMIAERRLIRLWVPALSVPLLVLTAVIGKNAYQHGLWSPSSGAGQNIIQNLNMALVDSDTRGALKLGKRKAYPQWWIWCYEEAERRGVHQTPNVAGFYGACMLDADGRFDFSALRAFFAQNPDPRMRRVVERDIVVLQERPWLWAGPVGLRPTGTSVEYGKVSQRLFWDVIATHPRNFLGRTYMNLTEHFLWIGAQFLVTHNRARFIEPPAVRWFNLIGVPIFLIGFAAAVIIFPLALYMRAASWFHRREHGAIGGVGISKAVISACVLAVAALSAMMACCENYRHAFTVFPLLTVLGTIGLRDTAVLVARLGWQDSRTR